MANSESHMRTSYFNVKDQQAFQNELNSLEEFNAVIHVDVERGICIYGDDFNFVYEPQTDENGDELDDKEVDVFSIIASHLTDGEAVLVNSIGYEKMRYLSSMSTIITAKGQVHINPDRAVRDVAVSQNLMSREQAEALDCTY